MHYANFEVPRMIMTYINTQALQRHSIIGQLQAPVGEEVMKLKKGT